MMQSKKVGPLIGIVDDDDSVREATERLLRSAGYRTAVFESAEKFLSTDHKYGIRCLVLDVRMPSLGGLELQRRLAESSVSIPIIFVTAQDDELRERALAQAAVAVLMKPFRGDALLAAIQSALASLG